MAREEGRGGGKGTHACRLSGKGCSTWNCAEGLNSNPCTPHESLYASRGKGRKQTSCHHSQLDLSLGPARREATVPFSCPFLMPDRPGPTIQSLSHADSQPVRPAPGLANPRRVVQSARTCGQSSSRKFLPGVGNEPSQARRVLATRHAVN
jgi:hypothetical protein